MSSIEQRYSTRIGDLPPRQLARWIIASVASFGASMYMADRITNPAKSVDSGSAACTALSAQISNQSAREVIFYPSLELRGQAEFESMVYVFDGANPIDNIKVKTSDEIVHSYTNDFLPFKIVSALVNYRLNGKVVPSPIICKTIVDLSPNGTDLSSTAE